MLQDTGRRLLSAARRPGARVVAGIGVVIILAAAVVIAQIESPRPATDAFGPFVTVPSAPSGPGGPVPTDSAPGNTPATVSPTTAGPAATAATKVAPLPAGAAIQELRHAGAQPPRIAVDRDGHVRSVAAAPGTALPLTPGAIATSNPSIVAAAFVNRYGEGLGLRRGQRAEIVRVNSLPGGDRVVRLNQHIGGLPVLGGDLTVTVDPAGGVVTATAETPISAPASTAVSISAEQAGSQAITAAASQFGLDPNQLRVTEARVWLYEPRMLNAPGRLQLRPTWKISLGFEGGVGVHVATVLIDAATGETSLAISELKSAKSRRICDLNNASVNINVPATYACVSGGSVPVSRSEGGPPSGIADVNDAYDLLGVTYDFYKNNFGRDSIDGLGMEMRATTRLCANGYSCPFQNAFWDGAQMVFGQGYASADDVVGHELTHGVTEKTSELFYYSESGGINEAMSDIFGQLIDFSRGSDDDSAWLLGEDLPIGAVRSMKTPSIYGDPEMVGDANWLSAYNSTGDSNGVHALSGVANKAAYLITDGGTFNGQTVAGIGRDKSAQLWYRLQFLMPTGTQYHDLAELLPAACRSLVGFRGFTTYNCAQVEKAVLATQMASTGATEEASLCPSPGQPTNDLFFDDLEAGAGNWTLASSWELVPALDYQLVWAHSGRQALDSYDYPPGGWVAGYAQLNTPIAVPVSGTTYLWYALNNLNYPTQSFGSATGGGTVFYKTSPGDPWSSGLPVDAGNGLKNPTHGYDTVRVNVSSLAGQSVYFAFKQTNTVPNREWLIDDVRIYQCDSRPSAPTDLAAVMFPDKTMVDLSWDVPTYVGPGIDSFQVSSSPAIPGLPTTLSASARSLRLTGLNPSTSYNITVRAIGTGSINGDPATTTVPSAAVSACPTVFGPKGPRLSGPCAVYPERRDR